MSEQEKRYVWIFTHYWRPDITRFELIRETEKSVRFRCRGGERTLAKVTSNHRAYFNEAEAKAAATEWVDQQVKVAQRRIKQLRADLAEMKIDDLSEPLPKTGPLVLD